MSESKGLPETYLQVALILNVTVQATHFFIGPFLCSDIEIMLVEMRGT